MKIAEHITGIQHIGLIARNIEETVKFYESLGFQLDWRTDEKHHVAFLRMKDLVIEAYPNDEPRGSLGPIDHISLNVDDVDTVFASLKADSFRLLHAEVQQLPFFEKGVRFFTIEGPNGERVEFNQILK